jgi:hypothetical protein
MSVLGIFISIGLIIDSFFSIFSIFRISPDVALFVESKGEANRATFFSESPTVLAIFYTFSLLCTIYCFFLTKKLRTKIMYVFSFLVYILGAFATNSRQILIIIFIIIIVSFIYLSLIQNKNQIIYLFIFMIASIICAFYANKYISNKQEESQARFTIESIREDERKLLWKKGMEQMKFYNFWSYPLGHGFVYTIEQKSKPHEQSHHHFESTVWASFYDGGLLSWFIIFFPCLYALHQLWIQKKSFLKLLLFLFFIDYGIICFVAPGGLHPTATLCSFITIGIILNFKKFNLE